MPRKPKAGVAAEQTLTLRMTDADRVMLDKLVALRAAELAAMGAEEIDVTAASFVRGLIRREAKAKGIVAAPAAPSPVAAPAAPSQAEAKRETGPTHRTDAERIHAALLQAVEQGALQGQIADRAGIDRSSLSRFKKTRSGLSPESLRKLEKAL